MTPARRGAFDLASHLGMTVWQLEHSMTPGELMEWFEYFRSKEKEQSGEIDLANATPDQLKGLFHG